MKLCAGCSRIVIRVGGGGEDKTKRENIENKPGTSDRNVYFKIARQLQLNV